VLSAGFEQLAADIHAVLPGARVEHVGSTSVPGLGGRGVIDAVVLATEHEQPATVEALLATGFIPSPHTWIEPTLTTTLQVGDAGYPVLLYVLTIDHPVVRGWLATRDHWRANLDEANRYAQVKRAALAAGHVDPWAYQQAKTPYLNQLARQLGQSHSATQSP
jgi:GrpB-like predicted nucleotidyltransferase (UPF0157 family)